jgi:hypothetical protein
MNISYGTTIIDSNDSKFIPVDKTQIQPMVVISQQYNKFSSLFMYDPNAVNGIFVHWLVINIPKDSFIKSGEIKKQYYPPSPPAESGNHQYMFQLYGHDEPLKISDIIVYDYDSVIRILSKNATLVKTLSFTSRNKNEEKLLGLSSMQGGRKSKKIKSRIHFKRRTRRDRNVGRKIKRMISRKERMISRKKRMISRKKGWNMKK